MSHIGCNSKNSFAIDKDKNLYTWGSCETSLLGYISDSDVIVPKKISVKNGYDEYSVNEINVGQFHVAIIADRKDKTKKNFDELKKSLDFAHQYFSNVIKWFNENIKSVTSYELFISFLIRFEKKKNKSNEIDYNEFEKLFLNPFYAYLKLKGKDFYHMEEAYSESIKNALEINDSNIKESNLKKIEEKKYTSQKLRDIYDFAFEMYKNFSENPTNFQLFAKLVFQFKPLITKEDLMELFTYLDDNPEEIEQEIINGIMEVLQVNENKKNEEEQELKIESNILIDCIIGVQTGLNNIFTWGIQTEGRLGYEKVDEIKNQNSSNNNNNENSEEEIKYQQIPKLVHFPDLTKITQVACGFYHSLALSEEKRVYSWGSSKYGCLGKYLSKNQPTPNLIEKDIEGKNFEKIIQVAAGMYLSMALNEDGTVFSWGLGNNGRLGHGDENSVEKPKRIEYFNNNSIKIKQISCGDLHCACISTSKELYTFGNGNYGKLGHCNFDHVLTPSKVGFFSMQKVENVACGSYNTVAVTTDAKVYAWGKNSHGMLGVPHQQEQNILVPSEVQYQKDNPDLVVSEIAIGSMHQLLLCTNGTLFSCGNSVNGILGIEDVFDKVTSPKMIINDKPFYMTTHTDIMLDNSIFKDYTPYFSLETKDIKNNSISTAIVFTSGSNYNSAFITNDGELYMSGEPSLIPKENIESTEQGIITTNSDMYDLNKKNFIQKVSFFREKVNYISLGKKHVICIADFKAYSWGYNTDGMCGITGKGLNEYISTPTLIDGIKTLVKMSCLSDDHSLVLTQTGEIYAFGNNMYGKLGVGDLNRYFTIGVQPREVEPMLVKNVSYAQYISCSNTHCACIMKYNQNLQDSYSIYTWGSGYGGKLGHSNEVDSYEPKIVEDLDKQKNDDGKKLYFIKVECGEDFTLALDEKGKLWIWGNVQCIPDVKTGKIEVPYQILKNKIFKFISVKGKYACAITIKGEVFSWGEIIKDNQTITEDFHKVSNEQMKFVSVGYNHCVSIDSSYSPYSWGSNLYYKCGYENIISDEIGFTPKPKRIESFYEQFQRNKEDEEKEDKLKNDIKNKKFMNIDDLYEINTNSNLKNDNLKSRKFNISENNTDQETDNKTSSDNKREGRDETQIKLLDESDENKNIGLMVKDVKINEEFFDTMRTFFKTMRMIENKKIKLYIDTQDKIISMINFSKAPTKRKYTSNIPLILSHNFQHYETFMSLIYNHPCYLEKVYIKSENIKLFMKILEIIYGKNEIFLCNQRTIINLLGLWNSIFISFDFGKDSDCEDSILYYLYEKIYFNNFQNILILNEIIAIVILYIISEILEKGGKYIELNNDAIEKINENFRNKQSDDKRNILKKAEEIIKEYLENKFKDFNDNVTGYSYGVYLILSKLAKRFNKELKTIEEFTEGQKKKKESMNKILNYFIFKPCSKILKIILDSNESNLPKEKDLLVESIEKVLIKLKDNVYFYKLYNIYYSREKIKENSDIEKERNIFLDLVSPTSEIIQEISEFFNELCNSKEEIKNRFNFLSNYHYDFTLNAVKEITKKISENGNELMSIPLSIQDLITLQETFHQIISDLEIKDPLRIILTDMNDFALDQLDSTSVINNLAINLTFYPNEFYFSENNICDMVKCKKCHLPVPDIFVSQEEKNECINGPNWICPKCKRENEGYLINCKCNSNRIKGKKQIRSDSLFFKRYYINKNDELTLSLEEALYFLPPLYKSNDLMTEINNTKKKMESNQKEKGNEKEKILEKLKNILNKIKEKKGLKNEKELIDEAKKNIDINIIARQKHILYLNKINEIIQTTNQLIESSKAYYTILEKKIQSLQTNISRGYVTQYFNTFNIPRDLGQSKKNTKIFLAKELIDEKVIQEILYDKKEQPKLVQKTYIEFKKQENGYNMIISYKEIFKKYVVCGTSKHNFKLKEELISNQTIYNLRRIARHNPVIEFGDISFNAFYLVLLINRLGD